MKTRSVVIIGAGPAGLGSAYELVKHNKKISLTVIEKNEVAGGLARTVRYKNAYFDVGPHRFYTKNQEVLALWKEVLGDEFIEVKRLTRILYKNKFFLYPIKLQDVVVKLGVNESLGSLVSFLYAKVIFRDLKPKTFEDWITKNFGKKLYTIFFKTYTEKIWGIPCNEIGAEWAAQRIKNLNFAEVVKSAVLGSKSGKAKSLVEKFYYPVHGAGDFYEKLAGLIEAEKAEVKYNSSLVKIYHKGFKITGVDYLCGNRKKSLSLDYLFSSMPLTHFISALDPTPPKKVVNAAKKLYYRDHLTVNLVIKGKSLFPDNWIYVHSPEVKMARVTNYNNFSKKMTQGKCSAISIEYFVFKDDDVWNLTDKELIEMGIEELEKVKLLNNLKDVIHGFVIRETEAYPTYYMGHKKYFETLKKYACNFTNLELIGRGGMYKYNNMDHAIYTGILAARNFNLRRKKYDVWQVNEDSAYLEEDKGIGRKV